MKMQKLTLKENMINSWKYRAKVYNNMYKQCNA